MSDQTEQPEQPDDDAPIRLKLPQREFVTVIKRTRKALRKAKTPKEAARLGDTLFTLMAGVVDGEADHAHRLQMATVEVADSHKAIAEIQREKFEIAQKQIDRLTQMNDGLEGRYKVVSELLAKTTTELEALRKQQAATKKATKAKA